MTIFFQSAYDLKNMFWLFERSFKLQKNEVFIYFFLNILSLFER